MNGRIVGTVARLTTIGLAALISTQAYADEGKSIPVIDLGKASAVSNIKPSDHSEKQVEFKVVDGSKGKALDITFNPGPAGYPGIKIAPEGKAWDFSSFGHVEAKITNIGKNSGLFALRIDNAGGWEKGPWNTEQAYLKPGKSKTVKIIFGYQYGQKKGYPLNPAEIVNLLIFTGKVKKKLEFRVENLVAAGPAGEKPWVNPKYVRVKPKNGFLLGAGDLQGNAKPKIETKGKVKVSMVNNMLKLVLPGKDKSQVMVKPSVGSWDLTAATDVRVVFKNDGQTPVTPTVALQSGGERGNTVTAASPIAPGAELEMTIPFAAVKPWTAIPNSGNKTNWNGVKGTGTKFGSDAVSYVKITASNEGDAALTVKSIKSAVTPIDVPDWVGKRPPVEGDWVMTFSEDFDGKEIDLKKWNIYGPNYWDKKSHWSKDNLILGDGVVKMHFEKKTGYHNDDPNETKPQNLTGKNTSPYACGYLDTYGKWVQRYGYFEARVKLPVAPGLWPTFWMMPDRGYKAGPQWKRAYTGGGAMEFDIMEHLTRWGPYRYNIAFHWDGYQKEHKQTGTNNVYIQPDKDGFIRPGMLWLPGKVIYYCNGQVVGSWEAERVSNVPSNLIFEVTTGGWDNNGVDDKQLPVDYVIDYVRVWQRKDLASEVDGFQAPPPAKTEKKPETVQAKD